MIRVKDWRMLITVPEQYFKCPRCLKQWKDLREYNAHLKVNEKPPYKVTGCEQVR